jgi:MoaA/NifB/PqqE/SkfB family radical SAM enzyme
MSLSSRVQRHLRIMGDNYKTVTTPRFLVLFINSICNMKCEHCFYWTSLNKKDDLTKDELFALSESLGPIENLNLSGGEPFIRKEFSEICRKFVIQNGVREIYVPTNGYFTDRTIKQVTQTLEEPNLELFVVELSLDGMPEFHDTFRVAKNSFRKSMETYEALVKLQAKDPRLRIHCNSCATERNMDEIKQLTSYLYERCPKMDHHNLAVIRGDRKDSSLGGPDLQRYEDLFQYIRRLWAPREEGRYGSIVEPMLQWAKVETIKQRRQIVPCLAGRQTGVVYANGDVSSCESLEPLGNLRQASFSEIWHSEQAAQRRRSIANKDCYCTTEVFMWPSFTYSPVQLVKTMARSRPFGRIELLPDREKVQVPIDPETQLPAATGNHIDIAATHGDLIATDLDRG